MSLIQLAIDILSHTHDGNDLDPNDLYLTQLAANEDLNELGEAALYDLHTRATSGKYVKPWLFGIKHLTKDHEGYIYWKGEHVEHYNFRDADEERREAIELADRCRHLERIGVSVNNITAIWHWEKYADIAPIIPQSALGLD